MTRTPKRPRDPNQLAKMIVDVASGEDRDVVAVDTPKVARAKIAGGKGGPARAKALSADERSRIASLAAQARWKKD